MSKWTLSLNYFSGFFSGRMESAFVMIDCGSGTYLRAVIGFIWAVGTISDTAPSSLTPHEAFCYFSYLNYLTLQSIILIHLF